MDTDDADRLTADYDPRPWVVCLCGSMRFEREMRQVAADESLDGSIVLMPHVNLHRPGPRWRDPARIAEVKQQLDRLHLAKIDAADEVVIVRPGGYMGESTRREMRHALHRGKPLRFRDDHHADSEGR